MRIEKCKKMIDFVYYFDGAPAGNVCVVVTRIDFVVIGEIHERSKAKGRSCLQIKLNKFTFEYKPSSNCIIT